MGPLRPSHKRGGLPAYRTTRPAGPGHSSLRPGRVSPGTKPHYQTPPARWPGRGGNRPGLLTAIDDSPTVAPAGLRPSHRLKGPPAHLDCQSTTGAGVSRITGPIIRPDISGDPTRQGPQDHCGGSPLSNHIGSDGRRPLRTTGPVIGSTDVRAFTCKCPPGF